MNTADNFINQDNDTVDILKEVRYYLFFWPWFLASVVLFFLGTYVYLRYASTIYQTNATLQVKDASSDPSSFLTEGAGAMFNFNRVKIDNYIAQIGSKPNLTAVTDHLDLRTQIYAVGRVKQSLAFGDEIPFDIVFKTEQYFNQIRLILEPAEGVIQIGEAEELQFGFSEPFETDDFILIVNGNAVEDSSEFLITRNSESKTITSLSRQIEINASSKTGDNIDLSVQGSNIERNEAIINTLIDVAHQQQTRDKQEIFALSINFINNRLGSIKSEIDSLTLKTTGFKSDNQIFSPEAQTTAALSNITTLDQEQFNLTTQRALAQSLKRNLENQNDYSLLPSNIGLSSGNVNDLVVSYNELVLKRKNLLAGATKRNPLVVQLSDQLKDLRDNIFESIDNYINNIDTSLSKFKEFKKRTNSEVSKIPGLEASLLSFQRKFQIAEKLYLFLLERREEASISYESTLPNTRVINYANTDFIPVAPKKQILALAALLLGLIIPFGVLYILKLLDTKIHTRDELEKSIPNLDIMGEVPFLQDMDSVMDPRGIFAEASRVIRSNISFKIKDDEDCKVILSTSSIKGEGKTLTAFNIAASYVAAGKKVLLVGADLRNPQLHTLIGINRKSNSKGLSNLISGDVNEVPSDYFLKINVFNKQIDLLLSGPIPPNPAELLGSQTFVKVLNNINQSYDYIVIDSAPLVLVSDTIPLLKYADLVLYTTRAHYTDKKLISFIKKLVEDNKINNIGLVLNGIKAGAKSYYKYGYSYRYSYQYKYNYGYGYGYSEDKS